MGGCAIYAQHKMDQLYGESFPVNRDISRIDLSAADTLEYHRDIEPILEKRCIVCHGCYDAPCQLKLDSFAGMDRGATQNKVYDGERLLADNMTRLFEDAQTTSEWRGKGFYPVLNERTQTRKINLHGSTLFKMLELKREHPLPSDGNPSASFDFSLNRSQQCPSIEGFDRFAKNYPLWGMPYGLRALDDEDFDIITQWLEEGALRQPEYAPQDSFQSHINQWESFLNDSSLKQQLASRYIFEHLFFAHIYFDSKAEGGYFKLVRSVTPPGQAIKQIATRRPYDNPGVERVYYRFQKVRSVIVAKNHMPYLLDAKRMQRWLDLFLHPDYTVNELPSYQPEVASNPFKAFADIPVKSRYQFMLDEARFSIMAFIKGPVCRGQIALNVIHDQFWVIFVNPEEMQPLIADEFLRQHNDVMRLPSEQESNVLPISTWRKYSKLHEKYIQEKDQLLQKYFPNGKGITLDLVWDGGEENNQNAALTIFRHFDSATVEKGFIGNKPKTAWLIGYPLLERIHYLLVAGFDVYGNLGHQLVTRLYMDFLRMEGEYNFLQLLPEETAEKEMKHWYQDSENQVATYIDSMSSKERLDPDISYLTDNHKQELFEKLSEKLGNSLITEGDGNLGSQSTFSENLLYALDHIKGTPVSWLAEVSLLRISSNSGTDKVYSLIANRAHKNVSQLFGEADRIVVAEQTLTVVEGILGDYPNIFFHIHEYQVAQFVETVKSLQTEEDYDNFLDRFAVRRNSDHFWTFSDWLNDYFQASKPIEAGILDYNRLDRRL